MQLEKLLNKENVEYAIFYKYPNDNNLRFCEHDHTHYCYNILGTTFYAVPVDVISFVAKNGTICNEIRPRINEPLIKLYTIIRPRKKKTPHNGEENI